MNAIPHMYWITITSHVNLMSRGVFTPKLFTFYESKVFKRLLKHLGNAFCLMKKFQMLQKSIESLTLSEKVFPSFLKYNSSGIQVHKIDKD